ncbi:hypothetical protein Tco_1356120 [Tanacetum coccineum]
MPLDLLKPPDPLIDEFCALTRMTSKGLKHKPYVPYDGNKPPKPRGTPKGVKNRAKSDKIKVQYPGFASVGAGALLKQLRNSNMVRKGRSRSESSPMVGNGSVLILVILLLMKQWLRF